VFFDSIVLRILFIPESLEIYTVKFFVLVDLRENSAPYNIYNEKSKNIICYHERILNYRKKGYLKFQYNQLFRLYFDYNEY